MPTGTLAPRPVAPALTSRPPLPAEARPAKVLLLLASLGGGGAERVAINLARRCAGHGHEVKLGLLRREGALLGELDARQVIAPGPAAARRGFAGAFAASHDIAAMLRRERPDVMMSFGMGVDGLLALAFTRGWVPRPRWIVRADTNPDAELDAAQLARPVRALTVAGLRHQQRRAHAIVAVSSELARLIDERAFKGAPRTAVIHNPLDLDLVRRGAGEALPQAAPRPFIAAAGRLVRQKGFDLLISAFAASQAARGMDLVILGEGPLEAELRAQAQALGVGGRVRFAGFQANPWAWFARARLFVLSSRWEGFGNVVSEAQACGAPVLAANCDFGPSDQIRHGETGWLCPPANAAALSVAMDRLLTDDGLRHRIAVAGSVSAEAFDAERVARQYSELFAHVAGAKRAVWTRPTRTWPSPTG